jgi:hypothetical protein
VPDLGKLMLEELQRRNCCEKTTRDPVSIGGCQLNCRKVLISRVTGHLTYQDFTCTITALCVH